MKCVSVPFFRFTITCPRTHLIGDIITMIVVRPYLVLCFPYYRMKASSTTTCAKYEFMESVFKYVLYISKFCSENCPRLTWSLVNNVYDNIVNIHVHFITRQTVPWIGLKEQNVSSKQMQIDSCGLKNEN